MSPNHATGEPAPLEPDQLDELLSAALDGEFDAAARDLGLSVDEAEARVRATPDADARRVTLAAARDLLAEPAPVDELLAARLRAKAVRAAETEHTAHALERKRRRNRIALSAAGIAAAIAAVVAVATGVNGFRPDSNSISSSSKDASSPTSAARREAAPTPATSTANVAALGSFTEARALALAAVARGGVPGERSGGDPLGAGVLPASGTNDGQSASTDQQKNSTRDRSVADAPVQYDRAALSAARCNAPPQVPTGSTPVLRASATLAGKPVVVLVFASATEHIVVIEDLDCKLLNLQMLG